MSNQTEARDQQDALAHTIQPGQDRNAPVAAFNPVPPPEPRNDNTAQAILDKQSLLLTAVAEPAYYCPNTIFISVNFDAIMKRLTSALMAAYSNWHELMDHIPGTQSEVDDFILLGCRALAAATVVSIYNRLRAIHSQFAPNKFDRYRNRSPLDSRTQLPAGLIHLVDQFGIARPKDVVGNCYYLHNWDGENSKTFGLDRLDDLNSKSFLAISRLLRVCKVPFAYVDRNQSYRTVWDTIILTPQGSGFTAQSTMPLENYTLPRDVFIQATLNRPVWDSTHKNYLPKAITNYSLRLGASTPSKTIKETESQSTVVVPDVKKRKFDAVSDTSGIRLEDCHPHLFEQYMHPSGISVDYVNSTTTTGDNPTTTIFGRGSEDDLIPLMSLHRDLSDQYLNEYWFALFTKGP